MGGSFAHFDLISKKALASDEQAKIEFVRRKRADVAAVAKPKKTPFYAARPSGGLADLDEFERAHRAKFDEKKKSIALALAKQKPNLT